MAVVSFELSVSCTKVLPGPSLNDAVL
jgi:hypothetical protein